MSSRLFRGYLVFQGLALAIYGLVPQESVVHTVWQVAIGWVGAAAIAVGVRRQRAERPTTWYLFAGGVFLNATGILVAYLLGHGGQTVVPPTLADLFWLSIFPCLGVGLGLLVRRRRTARPDWSTLVDTTIITTGIALLSWVFLIRPQASDLSLTMYARAVVCAYPIGDLVVLAMMVRLLLSGGNANPAFRLIVAALLCFLGADIGWAASSQLGVTPGRVLQWILESGSLLAFTLTGAAALHPSMAELSRPAAARPVGLSRRLLGGLTVASLIAPGVLAVQAFHREIKDGAAVALSSTVLFLLVVTRLAQLLKRVEEQSRELAERNRAARLVLDTINEGLLKVSRDGVLSQERSAMIDRWFGPISGPVRLTDYLRPVDRKFADWFAVAHDMLLEGFLPEEVQLAQFPTQLRMNGRELMVTYLPIRDGGAQEGGLLLVFNDVTEQRAMEQQEAEQRELLSLFGKLTRDRTGLLTFLEEAGQLVAQVVSGDLDLVTRRRVVHTLKGNAGLMGLTELARICHRAEDEIDPQDSNRVTPAIGELGRRWTTLTESFRSIAGEQKRDGGGLSAEELEALCTEIRQGLPPAPIVRRLAALHCEPVEAALGRLGDHARLLAEQLGKGTLTVETVGRGLWLDPSRWAPLWSELVHVVNNAVDHGIESPGEREAAGKPPSPRLRLAAYPADGDLVVEVEDDGRGIDWDKVRNTALERGLPAATVADWTAALLSPGFSTRSEVSSTSGRGIGLASIAARVTQLRGRLGVTSRPGQGACWRLSFPLSNLRSYEVAEPSPPRSPLSVVAG